MTAPTGTLGAEAAALLDVLAERLSAARDRQRRDAAGAPERGSAGADDGPVHSGGGGDAHHGGEVGATGGGGDAHHGGEVGATDGGGEDASAANGAGVGATDGGDGAERPAAGNAGARCPRCGHDPAARVACSGCPVCVALATLRGERPDTVARLTEAALTAVHLLRGLLAAEGTRTAGPTAAACPAAPDQPDGDNASGTTDPAIQSAGLVRIDIA